MKLTQEEKHMIESMRLTNSAEVSKEDNYRNVRAGFNSSLEGMIVAGLNSPHTEVKEQARELQTQMRTKMQEQGVNNVGALNFSEAEYNYLISQAHEATKIDNNLSTEYNLVTSTATMYNDPSVTDEVYTEISKLQLEETASKSDKPEEWVEVTNNMTGDIFQKNSYTGEVRPYQDPVTNMDDAKVSSNEAFITSNGAQQEAFGLHDTSLETK